MSASDHINGLFRAFSDPLRLRILRLLQQGEICVGDLVEVLGVPQPTASRHLKYLRGADLVDVRKAGRWVFYSLSEPAPGFHSKLLDCLGTCFDEVPELEDDSRRLVALRESGRGCCVELEC